MKNVAKKFKPRPLEGGYQQMKKMAQNKRPKTKDLAPQLAPQFNPSSLAKKLVLSKSFRHQLEEGEYGPNIYENQNKKYIIKSNRVPRSNSDAKVSSHIKINSFKKSPQYKENIKRAGIGADFYTPKKKKENIKNIHPSTNFKTNQRQTFYWQQKNRSKVCKETTWPLLNMIIFTVINVK